MPPGKRREVELRGDKLRLYRDEVFFGSVDSPFQDQVADNELDKVIEKNIDFLVNSGEQVNNRRQTVMNFFWVINAAILTGQGTFVKAWIDVLPHFKSRGSCSQGVLILFCIIAVSLIGQRICSYWHKLLGAYALVSGSKVDLMQALEAVRAVRVFTIQYQIVRKDNYPFLTTVEQEIADLFESCHSYIAASAVALCVATIFVHLLLAKRF